VATKLDRFTQKARAEPKIRFNALMGLVFDPEGVHASFGRQKENKAPEVASFPASFSGAHCPLYP
jgi:hypothetical protein